MKAIEIGSTVRVVDIEDDSSQQKAMTLGRVGEVIRIDRPGRGPNIHVKFGHNSGCRYYDTELQVLEDESEN